jgi:hypothetical protein
MPKQPNTILAATFSSANSQSIGFPSPQYDDGNGVNILRI